MSKKQQAMFPLPPTENVLKRICESFVTNEQKWRISVLSGLIFLLVSSPVLYQFTSSIGDCLNVKLSNSLGCPTMTGLLLHTAVFVVIVRILMG